MERIVAGGARAGARARRAPRPRRAVGAARALRVARAPARHPRRRALAGRRRDAVAVAGGARPRIGHRRRSLAVLAVGGATAAARPGALVVLVHALAARAVRIGHAEAGGLPGVDDRRGREGRDARGSARSHARDRARRRLAAVTVVGPRARAAGAVAVVDARDAV